MLESRAFSPLQIGPMKVMNRFIRSATCEGMSREDGTPTNRLFRWIEKYGDGEVGLIVPGYVYPIKSGRSARLQTGMYKKEFADAWKPTIEKLHKTGSKIMLQMAHGGIAALDGKGKAPSPFGKYGAYTIPEIEEIIDAFIKAGKWIYEAGADAVQLHCAHGYLLSLFLSPLVNRRKDKYGGSNEGRTRIVSEIVEGIRKETSPSFALSIKMNGSDGRRFGLTSRMAAEYVNLLKGKIDLFEISCGLGKGAGRMIPLDKSWKTKLREMFNPWKYTPMFNLPLAEYIKKRNPDAIIASVGGFRSVSDAEHALKTIDLVSMSRPLLREPYLIKLWHEGRKKTCDCVSCSMCIFEAQKKPGPVRCLYPPAN